MNQKVFLRHSRSDMGQSFFWGIVIIIIGLWVWFSKLGLISPGIELRRDWPVIIVILGFMTLSGGLSRLIKKRLWLKKTIHGLLFILLGLWLWLSNFGFEAISFKRNWPILIVVTGIYILFRSLMRKNRMSLRDYGEILSDLENGRITPEEAIDRIKKGQK